MNFPDDRIEQQMAVETCYAELHRKPMLVSCCSFRSMNRFVALSSRMSHFQTVRIGTGDATGAVHDELADWRMPGT